MKWSSSLTILNIFLLIKGMVPLYGQSASGSGNVLQRMKDTYTLYIVQETSLKILSQMYPDLQLLSKKASEDWKNEFGSSVNEIDHELTDTLGSNWETTKQQLWRKYSNTDYSQVSHNEAEQFIELIFKRALGKMDSPFIETLLTFRPEYQKEPDLEFSDGFIKNYTSAKKGSTDPLKINLMYPQSWVALPTDNGNNPTFISNYGSGPLSLKLLINNGPTPIRNDYLKKILSQQAMTELAGKNCEVLKYSGNRYVDNCPAAKILTIQDSDGQEKQNRELRLITRFVYKNYTIQLIFILSGKNNRDALINQFTQFEPLIRKITDHVVILSQWDHKRF